MSVVLGVAPDLLNLVDNKVVSVLPVRLHTPHDLDPLTLREIRSFLPVSTTRNGYLEMAVSQRFFRFLGEVFDDLTGSDWVFHGPLSRPLCALHGDAVVLHLGTLG